MVSLCNARGVVLDSNGNLYIADECNNRLLYYPSGSTTATRVYGQLGSFTTNTANNGGISADSLNGSLAPIIDSNGNLYISESDTNNRVLYYPSGSTTANRVYGQLGSFTTNVANNGGISANSVYGAEGMCLDSNGNLYLAEWRNHRVLYYPSGSTTASRVYGQLGSFTSNSPNNGGISANSLDTPHIVVLDTGGNLYISEGGNHRVLYFPSGSTTATRVYGQFGSFTSNTANNGGVSADSLNGPRGIAFDSLGNLYIVDSNNHRVLVY